MAGQSALISKEEAAAFLQGPLQELLGAAQHKRLEAFGLRTTYSPKVFIPLTMLCRDRCGYCTFAKAPAKLESPYLSSEQVLAIATAGAAAGCAEALFTLGEAPEDRYDVAQQWLNSHGYSSTVEYLAAMCELVLKETGLLPHANAGAISEADLLTLRRVSASQGMMIESLRPDLEAHRLAPDKVPARRLATLEAAGKLQIPFTTGVLVGIGEQLTDHLDALFAIAESHLRHGHIQEVIVQNFLPKPRTAMAGEPPADSEDFLRIIAIARLILPTSVHLQAPPNLSEDFGSLLAAGIDDWGGVSPVTNDHVNPERAWPALEALEHSTADAGFTLAPRLTIYPEFAAQPQKFLDANVQTQVLHLSDAEHLCRDHQWSSGSDVEPPMILKTGGPVRTQLTELLSAIDAGHRPVEEDLVTLFSARGSEVTAIAEFADHLRKQVVGDEVTFVHNRNINYTNVCTFKCKFCAFSKGPLSLNLRGDPYLLELSEITSRVAEAVELGATEVCLQGGIHPKFDGGYYLEVLKAVREASTEIHIHGFTALEVTEGARRSEMSLEDYLLELKAAGLRTLPGTAAEILDDKVRAILCPDKVNTEQWLEAHETAHKVGLNSNITIMFGAIEEPASWAKHMIVTRDLQDRTGGFTEFVPLPFVHMATPMYLQGKSRRGPTFRETLLMHAIGRIAYNGVIDNIQVSWVKLGEGGVRQILQAGANDMGGTLMDENISRAAGASHGQGLQREDFEAILAPLGRPLAQRTTLYGRVSSPSR
jgi:FO synthase